MKIIVATIDSINKKERLLYFDKGN